MLFVKHDVDEGADGERTHEDVMLRKVPAAVARRFRAAAGGRALTHAQYLTALVDLHEALRARCRRGRCDGGRGPGPPLAAERDGRDSR